MNDSTSKGPFEPSVGRRSLAMLKCQLAVGLLLLVSTPPMYEQQELILTVPERYLVSFTCINHPVPCHPFSSERRVCALGGMVNTC